MWKKGSLSVWVCAMVLIGCGGGGGSNGSSAKGVPFSISWAGRSRTISGPSSAQSAVVTLTGAAVDGGDLTMIVDRKASPNAYTSRNFFATRPSAGAYTLTVRFYAEPAGGGAVVAQGAETVTLRSDGSGIGSIGTTNTVTSLEVLPKQSVLAGTRVQLGFAAKDAQGSLVAVSPGSAIWSTVGEGSSLEMSKDGQAEPKGTGVTSVKVSLDGMTSAPVPVFASRRPITVAIDADQSMPLDDLRPLTLTIKDDAGSLIAVPREFVSWSMQNGPQDIGITDEGVPFLTGMGPGPGGTFAIAKVGGVVSEPTSFQLTAATPPTLTIDANQTIWPGDTKTLAFTARDKNGNVVNSPYGDPIWSVESGSGVVNVLGGFAIQAVRPGTARLRVHVSDLVSEPQTVTVLAPDAITLEATTPQPIALGQRGQLAFVARDAQGATIQIPAEDISWENLSSDWRYFRLEQNGIFGGTQQPGVYSVRVRAHGVYSQPVTVTILPAF